MGKTFYQKNENKLLIPVEGNFTTQLTLIIMYVPISIPFAVHYVLIFAQHSRNIIAQCST